MVAQAVLHRELLHVHASLSLVQNLHVNRLRFALHHFLIKSPTHVYERTYKVWALQFCLQYASTREHSITLVNCSLHLACYTSCATLRNRWMTNYGDARILLTAPLFPLHRRLPLLETLRTIGYSQMMAPTAVLTTTPFPHLV